MTTNAYINKIATAVPPNEAHERFANHLLGLQHYRAWHEKIRTILPKLGIEKRYVAVDLFSDEFSSFFGKNKTLSTAERMRLYQEHALPLSSLALEALFSSVPPRDITHLIVTSCTGFYAPGIDIDIIKRFGLKPGVERTIIGFMGCYAAVPAYKMARHIVRAAPASRVLIVNLELCSLHWRPDVPIDQLLTYLLFADGCAASLVSADPVGLKLLDFNSTLISDTLDQMRWTVGDEGFFMQLSPDVPELLGAALRKNPPRFSACDLLSNIRLWAIHPGGRSIVDAVGAALRLNKSDLEPSRHILKNYGNMSSATLPFILKIFIDSKTSPNSLGLAMAFGPGLVLESFLFFKEVSL